MNALIIEDEALASEKLQKTLVDINPDIKILDTIDSIESSIKWFNNNPNPDLVFCDIHLSDGLCFDIFKEGRIQCPVIFTTAYDHYAIRAFEVNSIAYLLKPVKKEKLEESLQKYYKLKDNYTPPNPKELNRLVDIIRTGSSVYKSRFLVKVGNKIKSIPCGKIAYFFTSEKLNYIVTNTGEKYPVDHTLEEVDNFVDPKHFFRVNRKFIIHFDAVKEIHPYFKGRLKINLEPSVEEEIVISSEKTPSFKEWLDQ